MELNERAKEIQRIKNDLAEIPFITFYSKTIEEVIAEIFNSVFTSIAQEDRAKDF